MFSRIGGAQPVGRLVDGLYQRIEGEPRLRRLFGRHLDHERAGQRRFFTEWLGGPAIYSDTAYFPLAHRHALSAISTETAELWLNCFRGALECSVSDQAAKDAIYARVSQLALALVNGGEPIRARSHGTCLRYRPAMDALGLARRGDVGGLNNVIQAAPDVLVSDTHAAELLHLAVVGGRTQTVRLLLDRGVDPNKPSRIQALIFLTPLCTARWKRRTEIEQLLLERGACEDVFTFAFLAQISKVDPKLAQAIDPAVDALEITPIHHAIAGSQPEALRTLLEHIGEAPIVNCARALRMAVALEDSAMVGLLLARGIDARGIGAGRWVLHPELAPLLAQAGAHVDRSGSWIGLSCTGNKGRKDDPDLVAALLRYGARVDDRRLVGQDNDGGQATALHYAAKAGFTRTIALLLEHGADPKAQNANGLTPLDWVERSTKSVDRAAVRRLLVSAR